MVASPFHTPLIAEDVWMVAPKFSVSGLHPQDKARVELFLFLAANQVSRDTFGKDADLATIYMALHLIELDVSEQERAIAGTAASADQNLATPNGALASETVGPVSRSFSSNVGGAANFARGGDEAFKSEVMARTSYGQAFITLRKGKFSNRVLPGAGWCR